MSVYESLNKEQQEAVYHTDGPLLILAGAGSGKTRTLTHRVAYLIGEMGVNPWNILAITFTNKAAKEMKERIDQIVGFGSDQIWVRTFHATCVRILRRYIDLLGYDRNFTIYDTDDQKSMIRSICKEQQIDTKALKERAVLSAISSAKNEMISPQQFERDAIGDAEALKIARVYFTYQEQLKKNNAMDFDDLLVKTVELFQNQAEVLAQYQEKFRYIMVDEYQDTNRVQFELVRLLAEKYQNLCVVGDDDQSIYRFRGADVRNILEFEKYYPQAKVIKLEQNYRSTGNILNAANAVIKNNSRRKDKKLWTASGDGDLLRWEQFDTAYQEAEFIAEDICKAVKFRGKSYADTAILYRTNAQSRILEDRFVVEGIPYQLVGGVNFYARKEIKDLLCYLKTIANGTDDLAVERIINVPKRGIGNTTMERVRIYAAAQGISLFEALEVGEGISSLGKSGAKLLPFVRLIRSLRELSEQCSVAELIRAVMEKTGYEAYLDEEDEEDARERKENIGELINKAAVYEMTHEEASLSDFLEEVALVAEVDNLEDDGNRVTMMTVHSAKGLEFSRVYLAGMEEELFPGSAAVWATTPEEMDEERRLCYVGITRAKEQLILTGARTRMVNGDIRTHDISRFVSEIPDELWEESPKSNRNRSLFGSDAEGGAGMAETLRFGNIEEGMGSRYRPKAVWKPRETAKENKPYILKNIESLQSAGSVKKGMGSASPAPDYGPGDRVRHTKFGEGTVLELVKETRDYKVTVQFDGMDSPRVMYASFAKLKRI